MTAIFALLHLSAVLISHLGWCESSNSCVAGSATGTACPGDCLSHWVFNKQGCTGKVKAGSFENIAPEASSIVTAKIAEPKVRIDTHTTEYDDEKQEVLVGQRDENKEVTYLDPQGHYHHKKNIKSSPVYGEIHRNVPVHTSVDKRTYSLASGERVDENHGAKGTFGTGV